MTIKKRIICLGAGFALALVLIIVLGRSVLAGVSGTVSHGLWSGTHSINNRIYAIDGSASLIRSGGLSSLTARVEGVGASNTYGVVGTYNSGNVSNSGASLSVSASQGYLPYAADILAGTLYFNNSVYSASTLTEP